MNRQNVGSNRPKPRPSSTQSAQQQAVLNRLRSGGVISGAQPATPLAGLFSGMAGNPPIPNLGAARLGGQEVLMGKGGWSQGVADQGAINVGGQTWYPAQSGADLVYKRAPGQVGGQYGSVFSKDQLAPAVSSPARTGVSIGSPAQRAEEQERSRIAQMTEQDPLVQKYKVADLTKAYNEAKAAKNFDEADRLGLEIWATTNPGLAKKLKPGQAGYQEATSVFQSQSPLGAYTQGVSDTQYGDKINFPDPSAVSNIAFDYKTPLSGVGVQVNPSQFGTAENLTVSQPTEATNQAVDLAFKNPLQMFAGGGEPLSEMQRKLLIQAFNQKLK